MTDPMMTSLPEPLRKDLASLFAARFAFPKQKSRSRCHPRGGPACRRSHSQAARRWRFAFASGLAAVVALAASRSGMRNPFRKRRPLPRPCTFSCPDSTYQPTGDHH